MKILVVGCGGTGGYVAEGLCRLLIGCDIPLVLIDHDRVEPHNLLRQHFYPGDVGKFKSQVLAERLSRQFGRTIGYSVYPYDTDLIGEEYGGGMYRRMAQGIIIGCVDNAYARCSIARRFDPFNWWIDAGNDYYSGQVLIGNAPHESFLEGAFDERTMTVERLPMPSLQAPSLLIPPTVPKRAPRDCAEEVADNEQSPIINHAMAMLVLHFVYQFLTDSLTWMGAYLDLASGTLQPVQADPVLIARMFSVKVDTLMRKPGRIGMRYR